MKVAVGYIRKSRVLDEKRGVSWEVQESKVRELAALNGDTDPLILSDWNISGRKGVEGRPGYRTLIAMIEEDRVSAIYAYNLARLGRSVHGLRALVSLADAHDVPVRLVTDRIDTSTATGRMLFTILAAVDEMTADIASEHSRATVVARQAAGHRIGPPFYGENCPPDCAIVHARGHHIVGEDPDAVVAAFEEAGSVMGACRLLNTRGVPTRMGGPWSTVTVRELLVRLKAMPHRPRPGAKAKAPFVLYGLLRCGQCAHTLTGTRYRNGSDLAYVSYKCHRARGAVDHGPGSVPEKRILPWIRAEAARLRVPPEVEQTVRDNTAETEPWPSAGGVCWRPSPTAWTRPPIAPGSRRSTSSSARSRPARAS